ncbi:hypothetical protein F0P96_04365 [Hymenobacter busanensis]|uniref:Uncharacterized protein n=1 Tax=Hymenobacter busanensis TaxID=2607656 RepID=A0A7L4ZTE4_9BACT|nr:hypothetical protein [Hymenobacter busanensis]KAA9339856.1 hypothetical protein F0P96_04365 [Hymenobacter busanensis]QHJ06391.1 hypothetical protein GUY19_03380 [Hymenobacter busanensis]
MKPSTVTLALLVAASTCWSQRASAQTPTEAPAPRTHALKLGLQSSELNSDLPTLSYEWLIAPRLSTEATIGYDGYTHRGGADYFTDAGVIRYQASSKVRRVAAFGQARYFLQASKPALIGWYVGAGLQARYEHARTNHSQSGDGIEDQHVTTTYNSFKVNPQFRVGRQWALGRRLSLDTFLSLDVSRPKRLAGDPTSALRFTPGLGLQLGYRF